MFSRLWQCHLHILPRNEAKLSTRLFNNPFRVNAPWLKVRIVQEMESFEWMLPCFHGFIDLPRKFVVYLCTRRRKLPSWRTKFRRMRVVASCTKYQFRRTYVHQVDVYRYVERSCGKYCFQRCYRHKESFIEDIFTEGYISVGSRQRNQFKRLFIGWYLNFSPLWFTSRYFRSRWKIDSIIFDWAILYPLLLEWSIDCDLQVDCHTKKCAMELHVSFHNIQLFKLFLSLMFVLFQSLWNIYSRSNVIDVFNREVSKV